MEHNDLLVLSVDEAATILGLSRAFTYQLAAQGTLPSLRLGRRVLIPRRALEEFVAQVPQAG